MKTLTILAALLLASTAALADDCGCKGPKTDFGARVTGSASSGGSYTGAAGSSSAFGGRAVTTSKLAQDQKANSDSYANTTGTGAVQYSQTGAFGTGRVHSATGSRGNAIAGNHGKISVGNGADATGRAWIRTR